MPEHESNFQKYKVIENFLESNGIVLQESQSAQTEKFYQSYHRRTTDLIKKAEEESKKRLAATRRNIMSDREQELREKTQQLIKGNRILYSRYRISNSEHSVKTSSQATTDASPLLIKSRKQSQDSVRSAKKTKSDIIVRLPQSQRVRMRS